MLQKTTLFTPFVIAFAGISACVAATPYNPDKLPQEQMVRINEICRDVMGLNPQESPVGGVYRGSPHLDPGVNHFQACVASLSDSVTTTAAAQAAKPPRADCGARSMQPNTPQHAQCVPQTTASRPLVLTTTAAATPVQSPRQVGNFFLDSPRQKRLKTEVACAQLGLDPPDGAFAQCVKRMHDNFFSIDNTIE